MMISRSLVFVLLVSVVTLFLSCAGTRMLHVKLTDFDVSQPRGLDVFRLDASGVPATRVSHIEFSSISFDLSGREIIEYRVLDATGTWLGPITAEVLRDPAVPVGVELYVLFVPGGSGYFVAKAYNVIGSSLFSKSAVQIL